MPPHRCRPSSFSLILPILGVGCLEYWLSHGDHEASWDSDADSEQPNHDLEQGPLEDFYEDCDGIDNDGDGRIDEGNPDTDGDGVADCVDDACAVVSLEEEDVVASHTCEESWTAPDNPWALELVWNSQYIGSGCGLGTVVLDANDDGVRDVACGSYDEIVVHDGRDGSVIFIRPCGSFFPHLAAADVDEDGRWELFAMCASNRAGESAIVSWTADGTERLRLPVDGDIFETGSWAIEIADLDGDGRPEIVTNTMIFDAISGEHKATVKTNPGAKHAWERSLIVTDLDGDGTQDIIDGRRAWSVDGSELWSVGPEEWGPQAISSVPLSSAGAIEEITIAVFSEGGTGLLVDAGGAVQARLTIEQMDVLPAVCAGDTDGDGEMEIIFVGKLKLQVFEQDGTQAWSIDNYDPGGSTGCTTFDFDLDGAKEIVHSNQEAIRIIDGRDGSVLWEDLDWVTNTIQDVPLIVDLDGDGSVELVQTNYGGQGWGYPPIRVYRHVDRAWPPGSRLWPSATWSGTSLYADGTVPRHPAKPWATTRVWRGQPEIFITGSQIQVEVVDRCVASCEPDGLVNLEIRIVNGGPEEVHRPVPVAAYSRGLHGARRLLEVISFDEHLDVGYASASRTMTLQTADFERGVVLVVGDDGDRAIVIDDCDITDNETVVTLEECG